MKTLTAEERAELEKSIELSIRVMTNTKTYAEATGLIRCVLMNAAKEIGEINYCYANPDMVLES